jgi:glucokinase
MAHGNTSQMVLAGDVGGTKTRLALFLRHRTRPEQVVMEEYPSREATSLEELIERFVAQHHVQVSSACIGIAGPIIEGRCKLTNLAWEASEAEIRRQFHWDSVRLVNDLTATGLAIPLLREGELRDVNSGVEDPKGTLGLVAPGTGLGVALLAVHDGELLPLSSEGGHVDFAPRDDDEVALWRFLRRNSEHASAEKVVSGPGILSIYAWLKDSGRHREPPWLRERMDAASPQKAIAEAALQESDPLCMETLDRFVSLLGAFAGNLALTGMTTGGMYLGGGICPQILPKLQHGPFMDSFVDKGRFKDLLCRMPVRVILNDRAALLGAALCAGQAHTEAHEE